MPSFFACVRSLLKLWARMMCCPLAGSCRDCRRNREMALLVGWRYLMRAVEKERGLALQCRCNIGGNHKFLDGLVALRGPLSHLGDCTGFIQCYHWFRCYQLQGAGDSRADSRLSYAPKRASITSGDKPFGKATFFTVTNLLDLLICEPCT